MSEASNYFDRTATVLEELAENPPSELDELVQAIFAAWDRGGRIASCGNGGSAADSQHFVTELVARFNNEPIHKPAICLTPNGSTLTAIANDWCYEEVFSRQVRAQLTADDLFLGISTSGTSANVVKAVEVALERDVRCFGLTGAGGGDLADLDCTVISVPSDTTAHIQEAHTACLHYVCERIDRRLNG